MGASCCSEEKGTEIENENGAGRASPPGMATTQDVFKASGKDEAAVATYEDPEAKATYSPPPPPAESTLDARNNDGATTRTEAAKPAAVDGKRTQFQLTLTKTATLTKVGLDVTHHASNSLKIKKIKDGLMAQWNADHAREPNVLVCEGDLITKVNGQSGHPKTLLEIMGKDTTLELTITPIECLEE
mmetsp:Transcript_148173/g.369426  ORF Transcript_148173/g.369426 Transcript_148173/m.369426 type:complete len:187 (+) Transcript_148173:102-662(+)